MSPEDELRRAEARVNEALTVLLRGDPAPLKALLSHAADATAFLGWGGYERGWVEIDARWDWAGAQFAALSATGRRLLARRQELLSVVAGADMGYTTTIEHASFSVPGQSRPEEQTLRVTHIYRREPAGWQLVHRHADRLAERRGPTE